MHLDTQSLWQDCCSKDITETYTILRREARDGLRSNGATGLKVDHLQESVLGFSQKINGSPNKNVLYF